MNEQTITNEILDRLPTALRSHLDGEELSNLCEIRFRANCPIMLYYGNTFKVCGTYIVKTYDINAITTAFCDSSVYAHIGEIKHGFITLSGGHRVGISGECIMTGGEITNIGSISGINIRIAREFKNCARELVKYIKKGGILKNTLIIAPPACGKTTMLRDISRSLSRQFKVTVIDERSEIAAVRRGIPQFDVGMQTDVLDRCPKDRGMMMALRSLSPDVIITDEIGARNDFDAICGVINAGCKIITSVHGYDVASVKAAKSELLSLFDMAIVLDRKNGVPRIVSAEDLEDGNNVYL